MTAIERELLTDLRMEARDFRVALVRFGPFLGALARHGHPGAERATEILHEAHLPRVFAAIKALDEADGDGGAFERSYYQDLLGIDRSWLYPDSAATLKSAS